MRLFGFGGHPQRRRTVLVDVEVFPRKARRLAYPVERQTAFSLFSENGAASFAFALGLHAFACQDDAKTSLSAPSPDRVKQNRATRDPWRRMQFRFMASWQADAAVLCSRRF
jgi:hypothetical protein